MVVLAAANLNNGTFYLFYDNSQFLYGNSNPIPEMLSEEDSVVLSVNCRNTRCISQTAGAVVNAYPLVKGPEGEKPRFFICTNDAQAVNQIGELVKNYGDEKGLDDKDIVILSVKSAENAGDTDAIDRIRSYLGVECLQSECPAPENKPVETQVKSKAKGKRKKTQKGGTKK